MKRIVSLLLACCLLVCGVAFAEEAVEPVAVTLPEVELDLGKKAKLWEEQDTDMVKGQSYLVNEWYVIIAAEAGEYSAAGLGYELSGELPEDAVITEDEATGMQRVQAQLNTMNAVMDVVTIPGDGCTVYLFVMAVDADMDSVAAQVDEWLLQLTIDGEPAIPETDAEN